MRENKQSQTLDICGLIQCVMALCARVTGYALGMFRDAPTRSQANSTGMVQILLAGKNQPLSTGLYLLCLVC